APLIHVRVVFVLRGLPTGAAASRALRFFHLVGFFLGSGRRITRFLLDVVMLDVVLQAAVVVARTLVAALAVLLALARLLLLLALRVGLFRFGFHWVVLSGACCASLPVSPFCGLSTATDECEWLSPSWGFWVVSSCLLMVVVPEATGVVPGGSPVGSAGFTPITWADASGASAVRVDAFLSHAARPVATTKARAMQVRSLMRVMGYPSSLHDRRTGTRRLSDKPPQGRRS